MNLSPCRGLAIVALIWASPMPARSEAPLSVPVEALDRRRQPASVAPLALVVVLEDPGIDPLGMIEERQAARRAHDRAQRIRVRWSDADEFGSRRGP